jgi:hypothetical protein
MVLHSFFFSVFSLLTASSSFCLLHYLSVIVAVIVANERNFFFLLLLLHPLSKCRFLFLLLLSRVFGFSVEFSVSQSSFSVEFLVLWLEEVCD